MNYRTFGRTGWQVSEIGFGAWAIGADWGNVSEQEAMASLHAAVDQGVNFIDTADVYGDGRSEKLVARLLKERSEEIYVATKAGRRLNPHVTEGYNRQNLTAFIERSLRYLDMEALDLVQLHCPTTQVYYNPEVFQVLDDLVDAGKIKYYGISVEKVEEAIKAIQYPGVHSVQIIFNIFRTRPAEMFFDLAREKQVAILARVPLASGLLSGKMTRAIDIYQGRPPQLQPLRRIIRCRRDLLRRGFRDRAGCSGANQVISPTGDEHGAVCLALDFDV